MAVLAELPEDQTLHLLFPDFPIGPLQPQVMIHEFAGFHDDNPFIPGYREKVFIPAHNELLSTGNGTGEELVIIRVFANTLRQR
jgi:hypothetical protein